MSQLTLKPQPTGRAAVRWRGCRGPGSALLPCWRRPVWLGEPGISDLDNWANLPREAPFC
jgi:hypothetical protein